MRYFRLVTGALVLSVTTILMYPARAEEPVIPSLSVAGTGLVKAKPDMAIINVGVLREAKTAREALDANNEAMSSVLAAMENAGIEERDLQTSGFSIQPKYFYPKRRANGEQPQPTITGYTVSNNLTIRIRDLDKTGGILDRVVSLGVNTGGNIQFTNADIKSLLKAARVNAVRDAVEKAETLTSAANVELGKITNISEASHTPRPIGVAHARSLAVQEDAGSVPIASGENEYRVTVQMTWEIEQ